MTNKEKAIEVLDIIINEFKIPKGFTMGDIARTLAILDPEDQIMNILKPLLRDAVIDEIKKNIELEKAGA